MKKIIVVWILFALGACSSNPVISSGKAKKVGGGKPLSVAGTIIGAAGPVALTEMYSQQEKTFDVGPSNRFIFEVKPSAQERYMLQIAAHPSGQCCHFEGAAEGLVEGGVDGIELVCQSPSWHHPQTVSDGFFGNAFTQGKIADITQNVYGDLAVAWTHPWLGATGNSDLQFVSTYDQNVGQWAHPQSNSFDDDLNFLLPHPTEAVSGQFVSLGLGPQKELYVLREQNINASTNRYLFFENRIDGQWLKSVGFSDLLDNIPAAGADVKAIQDGSYVAVWKTSNDQAIHIMSSRAQHPAITKTIDVLEVGATRTSLTFDMNAQGDGVVFWVENKPGQQAGTIDSYVMHVEIRGGSVKSVPNDYTDSKVAPLIASSSWAGYNPQELKVNDDGDFVLIFQHEEQVSSQVCVSGTMYKKQLVHKREHLWTVPSDINDVINVQSACGYNFAENIVFMPSGDILLLWKQQPDNVANSIEYELVMKQFDPSSQGWQPSVSITSAYTAHQGAVNRGVDLQYSIGVDDGKWTVVYSLADVLGQNMYQYRFFAFDDPLQAHTKIHTMSRKGSMSSGDGPKAVFYEPDGAVTAVMQIRQNPGHRELYVLDKPSGGTWTTPNANQKLQLPSSNAGDVDFVRASASHRCGEKTVFWRQAGHVFASAYR